MKILLKLFFLSMVMFMTGCGGGGGGGGSGGSSAARVQNQSTAHNLVSNIAVGDLNGDGLDDVVIGGWSGQLNATSYFSILIQNPDGTLTDRTVELAVTNQYQGSQRIFIGDFDHDGYKDIWMPGFNDCDGCVAQSVMLWGGASGKYINQTFDIGLNSHGACIADLNGDDNIDMLVRGQFRTDGENSYGYYLNNGNRHFEFVTAPYANGADTCSVIKDSLTHHFAIVQGNNPGDNHVPGFNSSINILDNNLSLIKQIGVASQDINTNDLIGSIAVDVNGDGLLDFVLVFNALAPGVPGRKEVWLNRGGDNFSYEYTIDNLYNNQYDIQSITYQGDNFYFFNAPLGDAIFYRLSNGQFVAYKRDSFTSMATALGGRVGARDWGIGYATVYRGSAGIYMLQNIKGIYYTLKL